ncbi:MAG: hypothetical protein IPL27_03545 [Lewinellaceae bacterium]|nr:hypothetical protein [Lewinellaceae bacterium]
MKRHLPLLINLSKGKIRFMPSMGIPARVKGMNGHHGMPFFGLCRLGPPHICFEKLVLNKLYKQEIRMSLQKVWNHRISMRKIDEQVIWYEDEITIYGGILTRLVVWWASVFYKHRQKMANTGCREIQANWF